jgi:decaprenylphospho-beta-D-erythro-pentofuranosid-2-ulose 2-reductase
MTPGTALILGASSPIARAVALELARKGWKLILGGRDMDDLDRTAADLHIRTGAMVQAVEFDALDPAAPGKLWNALAAKTPDLCGLLVSFGAMGEQDSQNLHPDEILPILHLNFAAAALVCQHAALDLEKQGSGWICGISSVAGDRGRASNYVYGSSKAGFTAFLSGLRNRLSKSGVKVLTVKPGFIDTGMTFGKKGSGLAVPPAKAAADIVKALFGKKDVIYTPGFWKIIMGIIKAIPEGKFKTMKI